MTDKPILFSAPMIRAILAGRKTQTRRLVPQAPAECSINYDLGNESWLPVDQRTPVRRYFEAWGGDLFRNRPEGWMCGSFEIVPPIQPGDRLWVREAWKPHSLYADMKPRDIPKTTVFYSADDRYAPSNTPWLPSIHMPRWASRLTLAVTHVRVMRLQDISEDDARAEGITDSWPEQECNGVRPYAEAFGHLWNSINGPDAWDANPWVAAYTFDAYACNIDAFDEGKRLAA